MFTPSSTASTAAGWPATTGTSASVAGRLFTRFASSAARPAIASSAGSEVPVRRQAGEQSRARAGHTVDDHGEGEDE